MGESKKLNNLLHSFLRLNKKWKASITSVLAFHFLILLFPLPKPLFDTEYSTILRSRDGLILSAAIADDEQWRFPPSDSIPKKFKTAIRLFEDEYFHYHPGINPVSIGRAVYQNIQAGEIVSGGSTLTMQTVRMAYGNQPRTYFQKVKELLASLKLDLFYSKESILKTYADHAPYGGNIVGISAASWRYYGRPSHQLSWAETATLAILPNDPASIFPGKNQASLLKKRDFLLDKIHSKGIIDEDELFLAKQEKLPQRMKPLPNYAYHLLNRAIKEGKKGTSILSSLDAQLQVRATERTNRYSRSQADNQVHNAASIIVDISSGHTLAYVGNTKNEGDHGQHVDVITAQRSPGSLLKPFLYTAALDDGLITPKQLLPDVPIFYKGFTPKNFDKNYRGAVAANEALTSSLNVPFVNLLIDYGYEKFHQKLKDIGFKSFNKPANHYGLSMILGGAETSLWELSSVYASIARSSKNFMDRPINKGYSTTDYRPNSYLFSEDKSESQLQSVGYFQVPSIDYTLNVLKEVKRPEEETGWEFFGSARPISWKTGTSFGFRDGWAIGLNGEYLVGVWVGNADGEGRAGLTGVRAAAPLLFELFSLLGGDTEQLEPMGVTHRICKHSGMAASRFCLNVEEEILPGYMVEKNQCTYHRMIHLNQEGTHQVNSSCYKVANMSDEPRFVLPPVQAWYYKRYHPNYKPLPPFLESCDQIDKKLAYQLIYPRNFTKVFIPLEQDGKKGSVVFEAAHTDRNATLYWHMDESYLGMTQGIHQLAINGEKGKHNLVLIDEFGNELKRSFEIIN